VSAADWRLTRNRKTKWATVVAYRLAVVAGQSAAADKMLALAVADKMSMLAAVDKMSASAVAESVAIVQAVAARTAAAQATA
jgi:hypothetical protein